MQNKSTNNIKNITDEFRGLSTFSSLEAWRNSAWSLQWQQFNGGRERIWKDSLADGGEIMRLRKDPQAILIFHSTLPHLATVEDPWISGKTIKVSSGMSHTLCWGCRIKGSQMPVFQLATLGSPRESETTKKHVCIPGPHLRLTEALGQAWKISILEIFPRGSERQLLGLNVLYDQTGIQKDFNRLEECAKKRQDTCDAEVSNSQNLSKVLKKLR